MCGPAISYMYIMYECVLYICYLSMIFCFFTSNIGSRIFSTNTEYSAQAFRSVTFDAGWFSWIRDQRWHRASAPINFDNYDTCWKSILKKLERKIKGTPFDTFYILRSTCGPVAIFRYSNIWLILRPAPEPQPYILGSDLYIGTTLKNQYCES